MGCRVEKCARLGGGESAGDEWAASGLAGLATPLASLAARKTGGESCGGSCGESCGGSCGEGGERRRRSREPSSLVACLGACFVAGVAA